jgi:hypothetical protein
MSEDQRGVESAMAGAGQDGRKDGSLRENERVCVVIGWSGCRWRRGFGTRKILIDGGAAIV